MPKKKNGKKIGFAQAHYNEFRRCGGKHSHYIVYNELSTETGDKLEKKYQEDCLKKRSKPKATR